MSNASNNSPTQIATLDVLGLGLSVEMFQQSRIWQEMEKRPAESILPSDVLDYPATFAERKKAHESRNTNVLSWAIRNFVEDWPIPSVSVWPHLPKPDVVDDKAEDKSAVFANRVEEIRNFAGLKSHRTAGLGAYFHNQPEAMLENIFRFFELNPEVPALLLFASDGDVTRMEIGDLSREEYWEDGPRRFGSLAESTVALLLARRDRIDALRPLAVTAPVAESTQGRIPTGFKPSKFMPSPWSREQIQQFDRLPTISVLHRPFQVSYRKDKNERPDTDATKASDIMYPKQQQAEFKTSFEAVLSKLEAGKPARIFYDTGGPENGAALVPLAMAADACLEEFDLFRPNEGYDIHARLGDTGAASPFVQLALGVISSFYNRDTSVTVNLRRSDEATITTVTPGPANASAPSVTIQKQPPTVTVAPKAVVRNVNIGIRVASGEECPQSGIWRCDHTDADEGTTHFIPIGRTLPQVAVPRELSAWQKMRGDLALEKVSTVWTLVSYE